MTTETQIKELRNKADDEDLIASRMGESVIVTDASGGRWHPSDEAEQEIMESARPLITAVLICDRKPTRGWWSC